MKTRIGINDSKHLSTLVSTTRSASPPSPAVLELLTILASFLSPPALSTVASKNSQDSYKKGQQFLKQKKYCQAADIFSRTLSKNSRGSLPHNTCYWLGKYHYDSGHWIETVADFKRYANDYHQTAKPPNYFLKLSFCYNRLEDNHRAMAILDQLLILYPKSSATATLKSDYGHFHIG